MIKLSIIVTFYNNSKYIENCINTFNSIDSKNIEIIIIDDGSKKDEYKRLEKNINELSKKNLKLIRNEENKGAGYSKNRAISVAQGEYIIFLDCDDYVSEDYYISIFKAIEETKADVVVTDIYTKVDSDIYEESLLETSIIKDNIKPIKSNIYEVDKRVILGNKYSASSCNKAIKRDYFLKFKFYENKCDDLTAIIPILCNACTIIYVKNIAYYYCQTANSITRQTKNKKRQENIIDSIDSLFKTYEILKQEGIIESCIEIFYANNVIPFIFFSILNADYITCTKCLKYLINKVDKENFADYLIIRNPYLFRLTYLNYYYVNLYKMISKKRYINLVLKIFNDRIKYRINLLIRRKK